MLRNVLIITIVLITSFSLYGQEEDAFKCWRKNDKLVWEDFKGAVPANELASDKRAVSPSEITASGFWDSGMPNFTVSVFFLKKMAWAKDTVSSYSLAHEQLHFDISELHARIIRKSVEELRENMVSDLDPYQLAIEKALSENEEMNDLYDQETGNGIYTQRQFEWNKKIYEKLEEYKEYASTCKDCRKILKKR